VADMLPQCSIVETTPGDPFVGLNHVLHAVCENVVILLLGTKHFLGKDHVRMVEHAPEETKHEPHRDAITETAGKYLLAAMLEVPASLKVTCSIRNFGSRSSTLIRLQISGTRRLIS